MHYYAQGRREKKKPTGVLGEGGSSFLVKTKGKKGSDSPLTRCIQHLSGVVNFLRQDNKKSPLSSESHTCFLHIYRVFFFTFF
jgi:hypothetical protein